MGVVALALFGIDEDLRTLRRADGRTAATLSPGLRSGWYLRASFWNARRIATFEAFDFTPRRV
jgi:hypothetical protein